MRFITVSSRKFDDYSDLSIRRQPRMFKESIERFNIPMENLWHEGVEHDWTGGVRKKLVLDYLEHVPCDEPVLLTDAWDAFFCGSAELIESTFRSFGSPVVVQTECNLWPKDGEFLPVLPRATTRWKYACGGGYVGYAGAIKTMFTAEDYWPSWAICDQSAFNDWAARHPESAALDDHCQIFLCLYDDGKARPPIGSSIAPITGRVRLLDLHTHPLVIHGGGGFAHAALRLWDTIKEQRGWN
jgi:hypothetical protein